jgi:hypothetical protein
MHAHEVRAHEMHVREVHALEMVWENPPGFPTLQTGVRWLRSEEFLH